MNFFGRRKPEAKPKVTKESTLASISRLQEQVNTIEKRMDHLDEKINQCVQNARKYGRTNRNKALVELRRKKMYEKQRKNLEGPHMKLEQMKITIEGATTNKSMLQAMETGASQLRQINQETNPDDVAEKMDDMEETMAEAQEASDIMAQPFGGMVEDEAELEDELNGMLEEDFLDVPSAPTGTPAAARGTGEHAPAAAAPAAPASAAPNYGELPTPPTGSRAPAAAAAPAPAQTDADFADLESEMAM